MKKSLFRSFFAVVLTTIFVGSLLVTPSVFAATANHVVISEIQTAGGTTTDEFIELYNPTNSNIDITGWRLAKRTAGSVGFLPEESNLVDSFPSMAINAHGYLLIAHENYDGAIPEDITYALNSITSNNTIVLYEPDSSSESIAAPGFSIVDLVGLGSAMDKETSTTGSPLGGQSKERKASETSTPTTLGTGGTEEHTGNGEDTDNNNADFLVRILPQPQDVDSASETPPATPTPTPSPSPSASPTQSPTPTVTPSETTSPTPTPTEETSPSPTSSETPTLTVTNTPTITLTESPSPTVTPIITPTPTNTPSPTDTPTPTPTNSPTLTPTPTAQATLTESATATPTHSLTPTGTLSETASPTMTPTETPSVTVTVTPTYTPTPTPFPLPTGQVLGTFPLPGGKSATCTLKFRRIGPPWSPFYLPYVRCVRNTTI